MHCPVCQSKSLDIFLRQHAVPVHQNLVFANQTDAVSIGRGELTLAVCETCGFIFNAMFDPSKMRYDSSYDNTQLVSTVFRTHVDERLSRVLSAAHDGLQIVEVGCGKGAFLRALVERSALSGVGFDPTYVGGEVEYDGRLRFERRFYDETCVDTPADLVVCRHVIEHVPEPVSLLRTIREALGGRSARLFFETPDVTWILSHGVIWDVFYEHCSYWTPRSLTTAFEKAGLSVDTVETVFGEQYLWLEGSSATPSSATTYDPGETQRLARSYEQQYTSRISAWRDSLRDWSRMGKVALWGAGGKGLTFANIVDPDREQIACVVDINPAKQGTYLGGTGHPIIAPDELGMHGIQYAILLNPNYFDEAQQLLTEERLAVTVVNLGVA